MNTWIRHPASANICSHWHLRHRLDALKHSATLNSFLILPSSSCRMPSNLVAMSRWRLQQFLPLPLDELQPACLSCSADSSKQGSFSFCGMRASAHLTSMNCRNSTSQVTCHNRSQSISSWMLRRSRCLSRPSGCLKFRPSLNGRTTTTGHRVAGQLVLSEGASNPPRGWNGALQLSALFPMAQGQAKHLYSSPRGYKRWN